MSEIEVDLEALEAKMQEVVPQEPANELQEDAKEEIAEPPQEEAEIREFSGVEQLAQAHGWNPKGEKSAEEWIAVALDSHPKRGKELKELKKMVNDLVDLNKKQRKAGYDQALAELQQARNEAIVRGDVQSVNTLDQQIQAQQQEAQELASPEVHPALLAFDDKHKDWINDSVSLKAHEMRNFIHQRAGELANSGMDPSEWVPILEKNLEEKFTDYFNPKQSNKVKMYPSVDRDESSGTAKSKSKAKFTFNDLSSDQKKIARQFERRGVMKTDEYIKQLIEIGELK